MAHGLDYFAHRGTMLPGGGKFVFLEMRVFEPGFFQRFQNQLSRRA
jgi:hypothetical protein